MSNLELSADTASVGATLAAPATGGATLPVAGVAEVVSFGAGALNLGIDVARNPMGALKTVGGGIKFLADEYILGTGNLKVP